MTHQLQMQPQQLKCKMGTTSLEEAVHCTIRSNVQGGGNMVHKDCRDGLTTFCCNGSGLVGLEK